MTGYKVKILTLMLLPYFPYFPLQWLRLSKWYTTGADGHSIDVEATAALQAGHG